MQIRRQIYEAVFLFLGVSLEYLLNRNLLRASETVWSLWIEGNPLRRAGNHTLIPG